MILLKTNKNESWQFFHEPNRGLCQRRGTHIPQILYPDAAPDFDVNCDEQGRIHLVALSPDHNLIYALHDGRNWQEHILLKRRGTAEVGRFRLLSVGRWQNLFYTITTKDHNLLVHHIIDAPQNPMVLDTTEGGFAVALSDHDTIGILYKKKEGIFSREYWWNRKEWTAPVLLPIQGEIADCIHLPDRGFGYLTAGEGRITYYGKEPLHIEAACACPPSLAYVDGILWIVWEEDGRIRACRSEDGGGHFDPPARFLHGGALERVGIRPTRFPHAVCNFALGNREEDGYHVAVVGKRFSEPFPTPSELRRMGQEVEEFAAKNL